MNNQQPSSPRQSADPARQEAEPWESWETRLCLWSIGIGVGALAVLGVLVNIYLL